MLDKRTRERLNALSDVINDNIDALIPLRDSCPSEQVVNYRYAIKKLENALGMIEKAVDRANGT